MKKVLSVFLAVLMVFTVVPFSIMANASALSDASSFRGFATKVESSAENFADCLDVQIYCKGDGSSRIMTGAMTVVIDTETLTTLDYETELSNLDNYKTDFKSFGSDFAFESSPITIGSSTYSFDFASTSGCSYNSETKQLYIYICGLSTTGITLPATETKIADVYLKLLPGATFTAEKIRAMTQEEHTNGSCPSSVITPCSIGSFTEMNAECSNYTFSIDPNAIEQQPVIDKSLLQAEYNADKDLSEADYTADSWTAFSDALNNAKTVLDDESASQTDINNALSTLTSAKSALQRLMANYASLDEAISNYETEIAKITKYTSASIQAAKTAYSGINIVRDLNASYQSDVDGWTKDVNDAISLLQEISTKLVDNSAFTAKLNYVPSDAESFNDCIRAQIYCRSDGVSAITTPGITLVIDPNIIDVVDYDTGEPVTDYYKNTPSDFSGVKQFGDSFAIEPEFIKVGKRNYYFSFGSTGITSYNATSDKLYIFVCGISTGGIVIPDTDTLFATVYFKLKEGATFTKNAVQIMDYSEYRATPKVCSDAIEPCCIGSKTEVVDICYNSSITYDDALFSAKKYNITFNYAGNTSTVELEKGATPVPPAVSDYISGDYTYTFVGWNPEISAVVGNETYTAQFTETFAAADYTAVDTALAQAKLITENENYTAKYTSSTRTALNKAVSAVVTGLGKSSQSVVDGYATAITNAISKLVIQNYDVSFKWSGGNSEDFVPYGTIPNAPTVPDYSDSDYDYTFAGWTPEFGPITTTTDFVATYNKTAKPASYTELDKAIDLANEKTNEENYLLKYTESSRNALALAVNNAITLSRKLLPSQQGEIDSITSALNNAITALEIQNYTISFATHNGTLSVLVAFGDTVTTLSVEDYSEGDYDYTFSKWDKDIQTASADITYTAIYSSTFVPADYSEVNIAVNSANEVIGTSDYTQKYTQETRTDLATAINSIDYSLGRTAQNTVNAFALAVDNALSTLEISKYEITFVSNGKSEKLNVAYGTVPVAPSVADYEDTDYNYSFSSWSPVVSAVSGNATYTALYSSTAKVADYTALDEEISVVEQKQSEETYNAKYTLDSRNALSEVLAEAKAINKNLLPSQQSQINSLTEALSTALENLQIAKYSISFVNHSSTQTLSVSYGDVPVPSAVAPYSESDYDYSFSAWDKDIVAVTGEAAYTAVYANTFVPADYEVVNTAKANANTFISATDYEAKYTETSRTALVNAINAVEENLGRTKQTQVNEFAQAINDAVSALEIRKYDVTFATFNGNETISVAYGTVPTPNAVLPCSEGDYDYSFSTWDKEIVAVTGEATYTAIYKSTFVTADYTENSKAVLEANEFLKTENLNKIYTKDSIDALNSALSANELNIGRTNQTLVNEYTNAINSAYNNMEKIVYTVKFMNDDTVISEKTYNYGDTTVVPENPSKESSVSVNYTFDTWTPQVSECVTDNAVYNASYTESARQYTVTFIGYEGTLSSTLVNYGETPSAPSVVGYSDGDYDYTFSKWAPIIAPVSSDAVYTAVYSSNANIADYTDLDSSLIIANSFVNSTDYSIKYTESSRLVLSSAIEEASSLSRTLLPSQQNIVDDARVKLDDALKALELCSYTVTFVSANGSQEQVLKFGETPVLPSTDNYSSGDYDYTFTKWDKEATPVMADVTFTALYDSVFVSADYEVVNTAKANANAIISSADYETKYTQASRTALANAINAVEENLGRTKQTQVNEFAQNINDAIKNLAQFAKIQGNGIQIGATVSLLKNADVVDSMVSLNGSFSFTVIDGEEYSIRVEKKAYTTLTVNGIISSGADIDVSTSIAQNKPALGDVNGDGTINVADISSVLLDSNYSKTVSDALNAFCDLNGDGSITVADIAIILLDDNYSRINQSVDFN